MLIVSLLDGHVVALDQVTGRILWSFDSGAPLVSAKQSFASSQGLNVFPGTDGGLYAYHGITHVTPGVEVSSQAPAPDELLHDTLLSHPLQTLPWPVPGCYPYGTYAG